MKLVPSQVRQPLAEPLLHVAQVASQISQAFVVAFPKCVEGHVVLHSWVEGYMNLPAGHVKQVVVVLEVQVAHVPSQAEHTFPVVFAKNPAGQVVPQVVLAALKNFPGPQVRHEEAPAALQVAHDPSQAEQALVDVFLYSPFGQVVKQVLAEDCKNFPLGQVKQFVAPAALHVAQVASQAAQSLLGVSL